MEVEGENKKELLDAGKFAFERARVRVDYLVRQYGFYTTHMNQVFTFYILASTIVMGGFVQLLSGPHPLHPIGSATIALTGIVLSELFRRLQERGFVIAGILDKELLDAEGAVGSTFTAERKKSHGGDNWKRNTWLFNMVYRVLMVVFALGLIYATLQCLAWGDGAIPPVSL